MAGFWQMSMHYGTGGYAGQAWIRRGTVLGAALVWNTDPILFPDPVWAYMPDNVLTGYLCVDPLDPNFLWVSGFTLTAGVYRLKTYVYGVADNTWTPVMNVLFGSGAAVWVCDIDFAPDGTAYIAVATNGALGLGGTGTGVGVYQSIARGPATYQGLGHYYSYATANINKPASLTGLTVVPDLASGTHRVFTSHNLTTAPLAGYHSISYSGDAGVTWNDDGVIPGSGFSVECFGRCQYAPYALGPGNLWYTRDWSGTGPYAFPNQSSRIGYVVDAGFGIESATIPTSGAIAHVFPAGSGQAVTFPTQHGNIYYTANGGVSWTAVPRSVPDDLPFAYRGGRTARDSLTAAGITAPRADHTTELWWTFDGGVTWYRTDAETEARGLSLDLTAGEIPPSAQVGYETLSWRDSRGFIGHSRYYVGGVSDGERSANAQAIANLLANLSNAHLESAKGPWTATVAAPAYGASVEYNNIEAVLHLAWRTAEGVAVTTELPCPISGAFVSDQETLSILNPDVAALMSGGVTYKISTRGGLAAAGWTGGTRLMRGFRSVETGRSLDPAQNSPSE